MRLQRRLSLIVFILFGSLMEIGIPALSSEAHAAGFYNLGSMWHAPRIFAVQTAALVHGSAQTTGSISFSSTPNLGDTIIFTVWLGLASGTAVDSTLGTSAVTDSQKNLYTRAVVSFAGVFAIAIYSAPVVSIPAIGGITITVTGFPSSYIDMSATEWSGISNSSPVDQIQSSSGSGTTRTSGTTSATTQNYELLVAAAGDPSSGTITYSNSSGFTVRAEETNGNLYVAGQVVDKIQTLAATQVCNWTTSSATTSWGGVVAAFRAKH